MHSPTIGLIKWPHPFLHRYLKCSSAAVLRPYLKCIVCHRLSCCERRSIGRPRSEEEERTDRGDLSESFVNLTDNSLPFVNQSLCFLVLPFTLQNLAFRRNFASACSFFSEIDTKKSGFHRNSMNGKDISICTSRIPVFRVLYIF